MKCINCGCEIDVKTDICPYCQADNGFTREILDKAKAGDEAAFSHLYQKTSTSVFLTIRGMVKNETDAEDLLQETYIAAFRFLDSLNDPRAFSGWIKQIARNRAITFLQKNSKVVFTELEVEDEEGNIMERELRESKPENIPEEYMDRQETKRLLREILESLSDDQRIVTVMFYFDEMSINEIAAETGVSVNTVKSRLYYARNKIETKVRELEKKGVKLYSMSAVTFFLYLHQLLENTEDENSAGLFPEISKGISSGTASVEIAAETAISSGSLSNSQRLSGGARLLLLAAIAAISFGGYFAVTEMLESRTQVEDHIETNDAIDILRQATVHEETSSLQEISEEVIDSSETDLSEPADRIEDREETEESAEPGETEESSSEESESEEITESSPEETTESSTEESTESTSEESTESSTEESTESSAEETEVSSFEETSESSEEESAAPEESEESTGTEPEESTEGEEESSKEESSEEESTEEESTEEESTEEESTEENLEVASGSCGNEVGWMLTSSDASGYTLTIGGDGNTIDLAVTDTDVPWHDYREQITEIRLLGNIEKIGDYAFYNCTSLTSVVLPETVTELGWYTFSGCTSLTSVSLPSSLSDIGDGAFSGCTSLESIIIREGTWYISDEAFSGCAALKSVEIPGSVEYIGEKAFYGCTSLTKIEIPEGVKRLGDYAFADCTSLSEVSIPLSLRMWGAHAFDNSKDEGAGLVVTYPGSWDDFDECEVLDEWIPEEAEFRIAPGE